MTAPKGLDVWGIAYGRDQRAIAAVNSRAEFVRLLGSGFTDTYVKNYGGTTGNPHELVVARAMPGHLILTGAFSGSIYTRQSDWARFTTIREADGLHVYGLHEFRGDSAEEARLALVRLRSRIAEASDRVGDEFAADLRRVLDYAEGKS